MPRQLDQPRVSSGPGEFDPGHCADSAWWAWARRDHCRARGRVVVIVGAKERPRHRQALRALRREEGRQGSTRPDVSFPGVGFSSRAFNALRIWSTGITVPLSRRRKAGWFSTAQASDAHEESSARFSPRLRRGWLMTSSGLSSRHKEVSILPERVAESAGVS